MNTRRTILAGLGALSLGGVLGYAFDRASVPANRQAYDAQLPNVPLQTHDGRKVLFQDVRSSGDAGPDLPHPFLRRRQLSRGLYFLRSGLLQPGEELPPIRTLALQLKVTPNTIVKAYDELETSGVVHKRRGSGTFVSDARPRLAILQRRRIIEQRIDALLAEAHQLNFSADDILRMVRDRKAAMDAGAPDDAAEVEK